MKKPLSIFLTIVMLFSLCACSNNDLQTKDPSNTNQTTNNTEASSGSTENPASGTDETTNTTQTTESPTTQPATQPTTCIHNWKDATCTAPKTCSKCNTTEGSATGHNWKNATCTTAKSCTKCGVTSGNALGHSWKNATCTAPKTCTKCGTTEGNTAGHSYSNGTCTVCGAADASKPTESTKPEYPDNPETCSHSLSWQPGGVTECPTVDSEGKFLWICGDCGFHYYEPMPKRPSKYAAVPSGIVIIERSNEVYYYAADTSARLSDYREWGDLPTIKILADKSWEVTYYNKENVKCTFVITTSGQDCDGVIRNNGSWDTI